MFYFYGRDFPRTTQPLYVPNGVEVFASIRVRDDTDRVAEGNIVIDFVSLSTSPGVSNDSSRRYELNRDFFENTGRRFYSFAGVTDWTVEPSHR